jgi:dephospho-CoA kinase
MAVSGGKGGGRRRRSGAEARLLIVVAGPNGAGKSTFVETFLKPNGILIVNPDEVAKGLSPDSPEDVAYQPVVKVPAQHRGRRGAPLARRDD